MSDFIATVGHEPFNTIHEVNVKPIKTIQCVHDGIVIWHPGIGYIKVPYQNKNKTWFNKICSFGSDKK